MGASSAAKTVVTAAALAATAYARIILDLVAPVERARRGLAPGRQLLIDNHRTLAETTLTAHHLHACAKGDDDHHMENCWPMIDLSL